MPPEDDPLIALEDREVPALERQQIVRQIDEALERRRAQVAPQLLAVRPRKRGLMLPLLVNLAAAALVAAGVLALLSHFGSREESIALRAGTYVSAEGQLLRTLRSETDQRLRAKDAEIAVIQNRLRELGEQSEALQARVEEQLKGRREALREDMEGRLAAERGRLVSLGTAPALIERRLQELQREGQAQMGTEIDSYRRVLETEVARQEEALRGSQVQAREALEQVSRDRKALFDELREQEAEIRAQFEQERQTLRAQTQGAEQALRSLRERTQARQLVEDQITAHYLAVLLALEGGRTAEALAGLAALEGLLRSEAVAGLPELSARRGVDSRLVAVLRESIQEDDREQGASAALADLQKELAEQRRQNEAAAERAREQARDADVAVGELQSRVERLGAEVRAGEERTARQAAALEAARAGQRAAEQSLLAARASALAAGRESALRDVMRYLQYASGSAEEKKALEGPLLALVREDPLYRAVTREIQLSSPSGRDRSPYVFLGVVSAVSGTTIVVDPMVELSVSPGALIQVRRAAELEREQTIGGGRVLQVRGGKITVQLDPGTVPPAVRDMVYVASRS